MNTIMANTRIQEKLDLLTKSFCEVLYEVDEDFLQSMEHSKLDGDDVARYAHWEWPQGVGLYGFWKLFEQTKNVEYLHILTDYYDTQISLGLPSKNINTVAPLLALSFLYEHTGKTEYLKVCTEWAQWIYTSLPRTQSGGFQHITSDSLNEQELWDDTLVMTVLFLANIGRILNNKEYIDEATYQFLLHIHYLTDRETGLWYHGWTFKGNHNFVQALWGRGNCWVTIAIPTLLAIVDLPQPIIRFLTNALTKQAETLLRCQNPQGMWHTLLDDPTSYPEASATCGIAYGMLIGVNMGILDSRYKESALRALEPILNYIDHKGIVNQVSYGTAMGRTTKDFYKNIPIKPMPYGQAIAILYLMEVSSLHN